MRTNVLCFFSSESVADSFIKAWEMIGSKLGPSLNILLNKRRPGEVLIQENQIPFSKNNSQKLNEQFTAGLICPLRSQYPLVSN